MPIRTVCTDCRTKLRVPEEMAGQWVQCPKCNQLVLVPHKSELPLEEKSKLSSRAAKASELAASAGSWAGSLRQSLSTSSGLGYASLGLGLASVPCLVVPVVGFYGDLALSGVGLLLGLAGLVLAKTKGERLLGYPLAGGAVCLAAMALAFLGHS